MNQPFSFALRGLLATAFLLFQLCALAQTPPPPQQPIKYLFDPTLGKVVEVRDGANNLLASYQWIPMPGCAELNSIRLRQPDMTYKTLYPVLNSPCGSITALTDEQGKIVGTQEYDSFGNIESSQGATPADPFPTLLGYRQEQHDPDSGLVYMHDRWFDTNTGRFLSPDQDPGDSSNPATLQKYAYAQNDPVNKFDPTGRVTLIEETIAMDENQQMEAGLSAKRIDQLNTILKNLCKSTSELGGAIGNFDKHHPLPQFAGAPRNTANLIPLPEPLHDALHRLIEISFIVNGFAPPNTGKEAFKVIFQSRGKKKQYLVVVRDVAGYIDKVCKLENAKQQPIQPMFDNIIKVYKDFVF